MKKVFLVRIESYSYGDYGFNIEGIYSTLVMANEKVMSLRSKDRPEKVQYHLDGTLKLVQSYGDISSIIVELDKDYIE